MKPAIGVSIEVVALAWVLAAAALLPLGPIYGLYVLVAEFLATYLIHCPAHYVVGRLAGVRFGSIRVGRTTLVRTLPEGFKGLGRLFPVLTLSVDKTSLAGVSRPRVRAMYLSGTVASSGSAFVVAAVVSLSGASFTAVFAWVLAALYLLFDLVFSPRSGDVMRARTLSLP